VIYVSLNYRLGPLGFPQRQEADNRGALNLGLKDQLTALEWVRLHIGTFGGDKNEVLVVFRLSYFNSVGHRFWQERGLCDDFPSLFELANYFFGQGSRT